jgi:hypothetical protein
MACQQNQGLIASSLRSAIFNRRLLSLQTSSRRNMQNETTGQVVAGEAARVALVIS